jgi:hypothetical protein
MVEFPVTTKTALITVPRSLDDLTFEQVLDQLALHSPEEKVTVDARHCTFATPFGLTALLALAQTRVEKPTFLPPEDLDNMSYWTRVGFFRYAEELYDVAGTMPHIASVAESDLFLEVTQVPQGENAHTVVKHIEQRTLRILTKRLNLEPRTLSGLAASVSAACQNIVEHAGCSGWVMVQSYLYKRMQPARSVVVIAVCDSGVGLRRSLEGGRRQPANSRWTDAVALETAVVNGMSRLGDPSRGQRLKGFRGYVYGHDGKLSVRSGTARIAYAPRWDDDVPLKENLAPFPGVQIQVTIPGGAAA